MTKINFLKKLGKSNFFKKIISNNLIFNKIIKNSFVTILYHQVSDNPSEFHKKNDLCVSLDNFYNQLLFFKKNFNIISPRDLQNKNFKTPALMITFDDGEKQFFEKPVEILNDLSIPVIHFLNMEPILGGINFNGLTSFLINEDKKILDFYYKDNITLANVTKNQVKRFLDHADKNSLIEKAKYYHGEWATINDLEKLEKNKLIFYGNHLYNHYNCVNLNNEEIKYQFQINKKYLDKFKNSINMFAYPYGQHNLFYNNKTNDLIKELGAEYIFTANPENYFWKNKNSLIHRIAIHDYLNNEVEIKNHLSKPKIRNFLSKNK